MEITIKTQCPNCREDIVFRHESRVLENEIKAETFNEEKLMGNSFFNIIKRATLRQNDFYDDLYKIVGMGAVKQHEKSKSVRLIQNYFDNLRHQIKTTEDPRELLKISRKLVKAKAVVSKDVQREISKHKPRVLAMIKKRIKQLDKNKTKK